MIDVIATMIQDLYRHLDYSSLFVLMLLESSVFPIPSELVMIPAGYLARTGELQVGLVMLVSLLGSLTGALSNYFLGKYLGKTLILKFGKYCFIDDDKYRQAEALFLKNAILATFLGRLIPGIRNLTAIPPGTFGMRLPPFLLFTALGAGTWSGILVAIGWFFGEAGVSIFEAYAYEIAIASVGGIVLVLFGVWYVRRNKRD